jgi:hypothetical protein
MTISFGETKGTIKEIKGDPKDNCDKLRRHGEQVLRTQDNAGKSLKLGFKLSVLVPRYLKAS